MPEKLTELADEDFAAQMQGLAQAATQALEERAAASRTDDDPRSKPPKAAVEPSAEMAAATTSRAPAPEKFTHGLGEMLRPLIVGLQAMGRVTGEHTQILARLEKQASETHEAQAQMPGIVTELQSLTEQRNAVSRQMFDALHEELRSYKDGFLLDAVHRPMIRDLISLYDDLVEIRRQMGVAVAEQAQNGGDSPAATAFLERLKSIDMHIEHNTEFVIEVLARLEVSINPIGSGKLDKVAQRAVTVEMAEDPDEDMDIVRVFKRGFTWKGRVVRAEEVSIKKWKEGFLVAMQPESEKK